MSAKSPYSRQEVTVEFNQRRTSIGVSHGSVRYPERKRDDNEPHRSDFVAFILKTESQGVGVSVKVKNANEVDFYLKLGVREVLVESISRSLIDRFDAVVSMCWTSPSLEIRKDFEREAWYFNPTSLRSLDAPCWNGIYSDIQVASVYRN